MTLSWKIPDSWFDLGQFPHVVQRASVVESALMGLKRWSGITSKQLVVGVQWDCLFAEKFMLEMFMDI